MNQGVDPYAYLRQAAQAMEAHQTEEQVERVLDELEYLYEVISPEFQDQADRVIECYRERLRQLRGLA